MFNHTDSTTAEQITHKIDNAVSSKARFNTMIRQDNIATQALDNIVPSN